MKDSEKKMLKWFLKQDIKIYIWFLVRMKEEK